MVFSQSEWVWRTDEREDEYVYFSDKFFYEAESPVFINLCCDSDFTVWINGEMAGFGKYPDFPDCQVYDRLNITPFLKKGENTVLILVWHYGVDTQTHVKRHAGLIYEIVTEENILAASGKNTRCKIAEDYLSGEKHWITSQLGLSYCYDAKGVERQDEIFLQWEECSIQHGRSKDFVVRPVERLKMEEVRCGKLISQGSFIYGRGNNIAEQMQRAGLFFLPPQEIVTKKENGFEMLELKPEVNEGIYLLFDLERECCGFLEFDIEVGEECTVDIAYGEHLADGRVRCEIDGRCFSAQYLARKGRQHFLNTFRRFGCRYLQLFVHSKEIKVYFVGLRPVVYPVNVLPKKFNDRLFQKIYDVSVRTLQLCMHDHYEDTPWREQALYTMDSRNQMLFGYIAFQEYRFARANLWLIGKSIRKDGLLSLCAPGGSDFPIPYFSLMYIIEMNEYRIASADNTLCSENFEVMERILSVFIEKIKKNGLIDNFQDRRYWNFYEWSEKMDGNGEYTPSFDLPLNAFFSIALQNMREMCVSLGYDKKAKEYANYAQSVNSAIRDEFFVKEKGLFQTYLRKYPMHFSQLSNSLAVLCGACDGEEAKKICERLVAEESGMVSISLSHSIFLYDALLKTDFDTYYPKILDEIVVKFSEMLYRNATSFWETEGGEADFDRAGSLCHGWSAVPIYVFDYIQKKGIIL